MPYGTRFHIVAGDGSIMGEVEVTPVGYSHTHEKVRDALEEGLNDPLSVERVNEVVE